MVGEILLAQRIAHDHLRKGGGEGTGGTSDCPTAGRGLFGGGLSKEVAEREISKGHGRCYTARAMLVAKKPREERGCEIGIVADD
ncbi:hypothetical protein LBMAG48_23110 [Phycisphaerae bacterium]|nr:hypothetical protein LBMAG48_23110 [Phycisphaerae bacterium]